MTVAVDGKKLCMHCEVFPSLKHTYCGVAQRIVDGTAEACPWFRYAGGVYRLNPAPISNPPLVRVQPSLSAGFSSPRARRPSSFSAECRGCVFKGSVYCRRECSVNPRRWEY